MPKSKNKPLKTITNDKKWINKRDKHEHKSQKKQTEKGKMYISTPLEINEIIKKVPKGKLITTKQIAQKLTKKHKVDFTCPLTTGIFISINANAAKQEQLQGKSNITPYWRVIKPKGYLYDHHLRIKNPQKKLLEDEGIKVISSGVKKAKWKVKNYENYL